MVSDFLTRGWMRFAVDPIVADWCADAEIAADRALNDPALAHWYQCENTWFVGVDALPNDIRGVIGASPVLTNSKWARFWAKHFGALPRLHPAQLSVVWPGYPRPRNGENDAAFRYRQRRHAAHVDGLRAIGSEKRRYLKEPHAFIIGMPLNKVPEDAAPLVVWEGSHHVLKESFRTALCAHAPDNWGSVDLTETYQAARRRVFETCPKRTLAAAPGEAISLHRHLLHGIADWSETTKPYPEGRRIAYFRPEFLRLSDWLETP